MNIFEETIRPEEALFYSLPGGFKEAGFLKFRK